MILNYFQDQEKEGGWIGLESCFLRLNYFFSSVFSASPFFSFLSSLRPFTAFAAATLPINPMVYSILIQLLVPRHFRLFGWIVSQSRVLLYVPSDYSQKLKRMLRTSLRSKPGMNASPAKESSLIVHSRSNDLRLSL